MSKWKKLNMELRNEILEQSIRLEQSSTGIIKAILRILKDKTKTLSNKSTSLSFKNKIDLLYDLDELCKTEYTNLLKFMEIRNQFIHNHEFNSFSELSTDFPDLISYLKKTFPNDEKEEEKSLQKSYNELYTTCQGKLLVLEIEYVKGIKKDYEQYVAYEIDKRFDELIVKAKSNYDKPNIRLPIIPMFYESAQENIDSFVLAFKIEKSIMASEILGNIDQEGNIDAAFKRKVSLEELIKEVED